ncbi:hypothetical protein [Methylocaldum szegediense]|nr:hypothetical protein [Methylocaldum szegediense]
MTANGQRSIAFALGGIGGSNAHGVGFLHAAAKEGIRPTYLSCTSGMIYWTWRWLEDCDLEQEFTNSANDAISAVWRQLPPSMLRSWLAYLYGGEGVFRPAIPEYFTRILTRWYRTPPERWCDLWFPAQILVPTRSEEVYQNIAKTFNASDIAIFFNSFSPRLGTEHLHMNEAAWETYRAIQQERQERRPDDPHTQEMRKNGDLPSVRAEKITAESVRDALWLSLYGFEREGKPQERIDGAYARQFILSELSSAHVIYIPRPQRYRWVGELPESLIELQDLQTELWFNGAYAQQLARIELVNRLLRNPNLKGPLEEQGFHEIEIVPIEIPVQRGFFNYFIEDTDVFYHAVEQSTLALRH